MTRGRPPRAAAAAAVALALSALAPAATADGGTRFVLAWPPTRYARAEVVAWRDGSATGPVTARVRARGLDVTLDVPEGGAARVALPPEAQCAEGVDACAITVERVSGPDLLHVLLQSPDTAGAADTLVLTAHDTARVPPRASLGREAVAVSWPCTAGAFPQAASFVTIVPALDGGGPAAPPARVEVGASACAPAASADVPAGSAWTLACAGSGADLSGARVSSDVPVLVLSGNVVTAVPADASLSGDLLLDVAGEPASGAATFVAPPLPRGPAHAGLGDVVRLVASGAAIARIRGADGSDEEVSLAPGAVLDLDTAGDPAAGDVALRIDVEGPVAAWHLTKSRARRGWGDAAAVPLPRRDAFTTRDVAFAPDGYGEGTWLVLVAEAGGDVRVDGVAVPSWSDVPGGALRWAQVPVAAPPASTGRRMVLDGDVPFGAVVLGLGGFKAHASVAAAATPARWRILRGTRASALDPAAETSSREHVDAGVEPLVFWSVEGAGAALRAARCAGGTCLAW